MQKKGNAKTVSAPKATDVKEVGKAVETKEAVKAVEETAKKTATPKRNTKKATQAKTKEPVASIITIQYDGRDADVAKVEENIKAKFVAEGHRAGNIKKLEVYIKPQDGKAYYVINDGKFTGDIDLF